MLLALEIQLNQDGFISCRMIRVLSPGDFQLIADSKHPWFSLYYDDVLLEQYEHQQQRH